MSIRRKAAKMARSSTLRRPRKSLEEQIAAEIANDPEVLQDVEDAFKDIENGDTVSLEEAFAETTTAKSLP
ncbi:MAG TPA: hypothetical protein VEI26_05250 [Terriglobales bacterium]|nr:hypothetical protein [Terriglobales bacterium]